MILNNGDRFMVCIDENNALYIFKNEFLFELGSEPAIKTLETMEIKLNEDEKARVLEMEDFVLNFEKRFLESNFLYSTKAKRKILYSSTSNIYFILERNRHGVELIIHPFNDFDSLLTGEKPEGVDELASSIAMEMGFLAFDPLGSKLLEKQ